MAVKNLNHRVKKLEFELNPKLSVLMILVNKGETHQVAKLRVMRENKMDKILDDALIYIIDI
jgi:hypothetical protein